jgi:hypothetical protein
MENQSYYLGHRKKGEAHMSDSPQLLTEHEAAKFIRVSVFALRAWRWRKKDGPAYLKLGSCVRYRLSSLNAYLESRLVDPAMNQKTQPGRRHRVHRAA